MAQAVDCRVVQARVKKRLGSTSANERIKLFAHLRRARLQLVPSASSSMMTSQIACRSLAPLPREDASLARSMPSPPSPLLRPSAEFKART
eukprot:5638786-Pleurochrysis_carterae.AAC.1